MELREVLSLKPNLNNIKKIDTYLVNKNLNSHEYSLALSHLALLLFQMGDETKAFNMLFAYLDKAKGVYRVAIYDRLISFYEIQHDYNNMHLAIENKKPYLPKYKEYNYFEDLIRYYDITGDKPKMVDAILEYLLLDIPDTSRLESLIKISNYYFENGKYHNFVDKNTSLLSLAKKMHQDEIYEEALFNSAYVSEKLGNYNEALETINDLRNRRVDDNVNRKILMLELKIMVFDTKKYQNAVNFEAEHEEEMDKADIKILREWIDICIKLYEELDNKFNVSRFIEKKNNLKEEVIAQETKRQDNKINYDFKFLNKEKDIKEEIKEEEELFEPQVVKEQKVVEEIVKKIIKYPLEKTQNALVNLNILLDEALKLDVEEREFYRLMLIEMEKFIPFYQAYLVLDNEKYHYKKERLYSRQDDLKGTYLDNLNDDLIINDTSKTEYKSIKSNILYKDKEAFTVIAIKLLKGYIGFDFKLNDYNYNSYEYRVLKLFTNFLSLRQKFHLDILKLKNHYNDIDNIIDNNFLGTIYQDDFYLTFKGNIKQLLHIDRKITYSEFLSLIDLDYVSKYQELNHLKKNIIIYKFKDLDLYVKEIKYRTLEHNYSLLIDISEELKLERDLKLDPEVKVNNKISLDKKIKEIDDKCSFVLLRATNTKLYEEIYGYDFGYDLNYAIGKYLNKYDKKNYETYYIDKYEYLLIFDNLVDKRTITNISLEIDEYLVKRINQLNSRVNLEFEYAILRYPTDTKDLDINNILKLLNFSFNDEKVNVYDKLIYKKRMFESSLITHISESIDQNELLINYHQVINYDTKNIKALRLDFNLTNYPIDEKLIHDISKKRMIVPNLERYLIHKGLFELKEVFNNKAYYLNFIFNVSYETLNEKFCYYLIEQAKFFNVPLSAITINYDGELDSKHLEDLVFLKNNKVKISSSNFELLRKLDLSIFFYENLSSDYLFKAIVSNLHERNIDLVVTGIDKEEDISKYALEGIKYYQGKRFGKLLKLSDLIK